MQLTMLNIREDFKVLYGVVTDVSIFVMNVFAPAKASPKVLLHYVSMKIITSSALTERDNEVVLVDPLPLRMTLSFLKGAAIWFAGTFRTLIPGLSVRSVFGATFNGAVFNLTLSAAIPKNIAAWAFNIPNFFGHIYIEYNMETMALTGSST